MDLIKEIRKELLKNVDEKYRISSQRFSKEEIKSYGVRTNIVRKIAKKHFNDVKKLGKNKVFLLSGQLLKSGYDEEATIAIQWVSGFRNEFEKKYFAIFEKWLDKYINNWGKDDDFCLNVLSHFISKYPEYKEKVKSWTVSRNRWKRRASAVVFIKGGGIWKVDPRYMKDVFDVSIALMNDKDDLVQKGFGWALKVASETHQTDVFNFVMKHKSIMPRTSLRYAIEKMPISMKKEAMQKV